MFKTLDIQFQVHSVPEIGRQRLEQTHFSCGLSQIYHTQTRLEHQCGPLTSISCTQGFLPYKNIVSSDELENTIKTIREIQDAPDTTPFYKYQLDLVIAHLESDKSANLQYIMIPAGANLTEEGLRTQNMWHPPDNTRAHRMALGPALQYPVSRGSCHIKSAGKLYKSADSCFK